jgi:hypothetical protein
MTKIPIKTYKIIKIHHKTIEMKEISSEIFKMTMISLKFLGVALKLLKVPQKQLLKVLVIMHVHV